MGVIEPVRAPILFKLFPWTHLILKLVGAAYLVWAGMRMWRHAKAIAFYTSVFSAAAPSPNKTLTLWVALAIALSIAVLWYGLVAVALSSGPIALGYCRAKTWIERACGALMIAFGVELAALR